MTLSEMTHILVRDTSLFGATVLTGQYSIGADKVRFAQ